MSISTDTVNNPRVDSLVNRINSLNDVFDQAEKVCSSEIVDFIEEKTHDVKLYSSMDSDISTTDVIKLDLMVDDFKFTRDTLTETVNNGRKVLNVVTLELLDSDEENRASLITSFAELVTSVNQSVKLLSQSYKDIAAVLESIEKIRKSKLATPEQAQPVGTGNTFINITTQESTTDIIARLTKKKSDG
jgi:predicted protein tyrosine phosphatase